MYNKTLMDLISASYGVECDTVEHLEPSIGNTRKLQFIPYNPNRLCIVIVNNGANTMFMTTDNNTAIDDGIALSPYGGSVALQWDRDFTLVSSQYAFSTLVGTSKLYWLEVITRSQGNPKQ